MRFSAICYGAILVAGLAPRVLLAGDADAVNERLPVTNMEMEEHWRVDCSHSWFTLPGRPGKGPGPGKCALAAEPLKQLQLCAFIYQTPGDEIVELCRDFQGVIQAAQEGNCEEISALVEKSEKCDAAQR